MERRQVTSEPESEPESWSRLGPITKSVLAIEYLRDLVAGTFGRAWYRGLTGEDRHRHDFEAPLLIVPYVDGRLTPETRAFGEQHEAAFVDLTGDDHGYFKLISRLWSAGRQFIVVEEDVVPNDEQFVSLVTCSEPWCAGVHKLVGVECANEIWSLGLMKFSRELLARHFEQTDPSSDTPDGPKMFAAMLDDNRHWQRIDFAIYNVLHFHYPQPHLHGPAGRHLGIAR